MYNTIINIFENLRRRSMSIHNKTILILTAQFGAGHISAAKGIKDYLLEEYSSSNI